MGTECGSASRRGSVSPPENAEVEVAISEGGHVIDQLQFDADTLASKTSEAVPMHRAVKRAVEPSDDL